MTDTIKDVMELLIEYANGGMSGLYPPEDDIQELVDYILDLQEQLDETRKSELDKEYRISKAIEFINKHFYAKKNLNDLYSDERVLEMTIETLKGSDKK